MSFIVESLIISVFTSQSKKLSWFFNKMALKNFKTTFLKLKIFDISKMKCDSSNNAKNEAVKNDK